MAALLASRISVEPEFPLLRAGAASSASSGGGVSLPSRGGRSVASNGGWSDGPALGAALATLLDGARSAVSVRGGGACVALTTRFGAGGSLLTMREGLGLAGGGGGGPASVAGAG